MDLSAKKKMRQRNALLLVSKFGTIIGLFIMLLAFSIAVPNIFPKARNLVNIVNQASLSAIIAGGLTVALIVGEMDLSIAYLASFAGVLVTGLMANYHLPVPLAMLVVVLVSILVGIANGLIITKLKVNSVVATLGTGSIVVGLNYMYARACRLRPACLIRSRCWLSAGPPAFPTTSSSCSPSFWCCGCF